jgi:acetylornithine deacetylase/succinyl-diaminopimelate desuccinylase-like protein
MVVEVEEFIRRELAPLVAIPSVTGQEFLIQPYLEHLLEDLGLQPEQQPVAGGRYNLVVRPRAKPALLLVAHVDTVGDFGQPGLFVPRREGTRLYGRGAGDSKAGVVAVLAAVREALTFGLAVEHVALAFTVDEEEGGRGSVVLAEEMEAQGAIGLEPTRLAIYPAQAGALEVEFTVPGYSAHGSAFEEGTNAIEKAWELIQALRQSPFVRHRHPLIGPGGINVLSIAGGSTALMVPNLRRLRVDVRVLPGQDVQQWLAHLEEISRRFEATLTVHDISPPFELPPETPVVSLLARATRNITGQEPKFSGMKSWTDAEPLVSRGIAAVPFGPGELAVAHTNREYVELPDVITATQILAEAIRLAPEVLPIPS